MKYEDTIGSQRPRKPGYRSPARQVSAEERRRRSFSKQLIAALEEAASGAPPSKTPEQLARAAYDKLQFDFPVGACWQHAFAQLSPHDAWRQHRSCRNALCGCLRGSI